MAHTTSTTLNFQIRTVIFVMMYLYISYSIRLSFSLYFNQIVCRTRNQVQLLDSPRGNR